MAAAQVRGDAVHQVGRNVVLGIAAGRAAIGVGALFATRPALSALGFPQPGTVGLTLARLAGGRDLALATLAFAAIDDDAALRKAALAAAAVDAIDAVSFGIAGRDAEFRRAGIGGAISGGAAAVAGAWAASRLSG